MRVDTVGPVHNRVNLGGRECQDLIESCDINIPRFPGLLAPVIGPEI